MHLDVSLVALIISTLSLQGLFIWTIQQVSEYSSIA